MTLFLRLGLNWQIFGVFLKDCGLRFDLSIFYSRTKPFFGIYFISSDMWVDNNWKGNSWFILVFHVSARY